MAKFMPFTMLGYPNKEKCLETIYAMIDSGADALELGIAFSDPIADGPIIQQAAADTVESGFSVDDAFDLISSVREYDGEIPVNLMVYYNMVLKYGTEQFYQRAIQLGVNGILIVDLPPEEAEPVVAIAKSNEIAQIFIVSPLTSDERLKLILKYASGYLYIVSRLGITGVDDTYDEQLASLITKVKQATTLPLFVGFGISTPAQAEKMSSLGADGVITGSKIIDLVRSSAGAELKEYLRTMVDSCHSDAVPLRCHSER